MKIKTIALNQRMQQWVMNMKDKLGFYGSISLAVFLFILFFQPFPNKISDFNNALIFTAGFGVIVLLLMYFCNLIFSGFSQRRESEVLSYFHGLVLLILCSVAFAFYLRFVGQVKISFPMALKIVLVSLAPPISLRIYDLRNQYRHDYNQLLEEYETLKRKNELFEESNRHQTIEFLSTNFNENIRLLLSDIVLVKSADNYVEIYYMDDNLVKKKLVRNTLNNMEQQLRPYTFFQRCHRTYIVNIGYIDMIIRKISSYRLVIRDLEERIPLSRQYILRIKEALALKQG